MGRVADQLAAMTITTTSPDGRIKARVKERRPEQLAFRPGGFDSYRRPELEHQLGRLASLSFVGYQRGVEKIIDETGLDVATDPRRARTPAQRRYLEDYAKLTVVGPIRDRPVVFAVKGVAHWHCRLTRDTLDELSESEFVTACLTAASEFMTRFDFEKTLLQNEHFGKRRINRIDPDNLPRPTRLRPIPTATTPRS